MSHAVIAENLGPIPRVEFAIEGHGVTVLSAPNGSGKSILLDAMSAAARGKGSLPLRDGMKAGRLTGFGATVTIGASSRHKGCFEVQHLEGKFSLADLVDPGVESPAAADAKRIKALITLTGVEASSFVFAGLDDFATVVAPESLKTDDLLEMSRRIKSDYEKAARTAEAAAEREFGKAAGLSTDAGLDMDAESNADVLQDAYNAARDELAMARERVQVWERQKVSVEEARKMMAEAEAIGSGETREALLQEEKTLTALISQNAFEIRQLEEKLASLREERKEFGHRSELLMQRQKSLVDQEQLIGVAQSVLANFDETSAPNPDEIEAAQAKVLAAKSAMEQGVLIREAVKKNAEAAVARKEGQAWKDKGDQYREAGKAAEDKLSTLINSPYLRVENDGKAARLFVTTGRGPTPFHELSMGEKWKIAIDLGADAVGEDGLLVIPQEAFESLDADNRRLVHEHGVGRRVFILTAEASRESSSDRSIVARPYSLFEGQDSPA